MVGLIAEALSDVEILISDPFVSTMPRALAGHKNLRLANAYEAVDRADIVVLLVEHDPFKALRNTRLGGKVIYDTRGAWR